MNLYFRLVWKLLIALLAYRRDGASITFPKGTSDLSFRVLPLDCDVNGHMTHSRYSSFSDIGRFDWAIRSGMGRLIRDNKWAPMVGSIHWEYRREIKPFERFTLSTRFLGWDGTNFLAEHLYTVVRAGETVLCTRGLARVGFYDRKQKSFVDGRELADTLGYDQAAPALDDVEAQFLKTRLTKRKAQQTKATGNTEHAHN